MSAVAGCLGITVALGHCLGLLYIVRIGRIGSSLTQLNPQAVESKVLVSSEPGKSHSGVVLCCLGLGLLPGS